MYRWASAMQHVDVRGLSTQVDASGDIDIAPSLEWIDGALFTGHESALIVLDMLNDAASLGFEQDVKAAVDAFVDAWEMPSANP